MAAERGNDMMYKVSRKIDYKQYKGGVIDSDLKFALEMIREEVREGHEMELREKRGSRWYKVDWTKLVNWDPKTGKRIVKRGK